MWFQGRSSFKVQSEYQRSKHAQLDLKYINHSELHRRKERGRLLWSEKLKLLTIKYIYVFYSNRQKLFPGNRKKQVRLFCHTVCGSTTYVCPAPHLGLPKNRAKACLGTWTENRQCYQTFQVLKKLPVIFLLRERTRDTAWTGVGSPSHNRHQVSS